MKLLLVCCFLVASTTALSTPSSNSGRSRRRPMRLNRALRTTLSRRQTNRIIADRRMHVNGKIETNPNTRLILGDVVLMDGKAVVWHESQLEQQQPHRYLKFHKPAGVVVTTNLQVPQNIMEAFERLSGNTTTAVESSNERRVYPIGRLDAESTGLILLTSNGAIVNSLLRTTSSSTQHRRKKSKEYHVTTVPPATDKDIAKLAAGVVITTPARVDGSISQVTKRTRPCTVERITLQDTTAAVSSSGRTDDGGLLKIVLTQGRNRQIRHMTASLGLRVTSLHRVQFCGVSLAGIDIPGSWAPLTAAEELAIGARSRNDQRSPAEKAARKAKKASKKRKKM